MIGIVDYGVGNVNAFCRVYKLLGVPHKLLSRPADFDDQLTKIILPGVGAFDHAIKSLNKSGLREKLTDCVLGDKLPTLGVCVGFQMLCERSEEGIEPGLHWIDGEVTKISKESLASYMPLPHMGWNHIELRNPSMLTEGLNASTGFYFLHSFQVVTSSAHVVATSFYGAEIACIYENNNIIGIQPHPEKSHSNGVKFLENFGAFNAAL